MRFHLIDALRGIAALWVVFFHAYEGSHINKLTDILPNAVVGIVFKKGELGVPIFFVISGFVIAHSLRNDNINASYFAKFTLRRSIRLDPPYWASVLFCISFAWISSVVKNEEMFWPSRESIIAHLFYAQTLLEFKHINIIYWTLCLEIQFYLIFCLLLTISQFFEKFYENSRLIILFSVIIVSLLWPLGILQKNLHPGLFLPHWHGFILGVFAYWSWQQKLHPLFLYIYSALILTGGMLFHSNFSITTTIMALLIYESAKLGHISSMNWKWLQFLGLISYSLYLTHNPITGAVFFLTYKLIGSSVLTQFFALGIDIAICILFAFLYWWLFEKWSINLSKKIILHKTSTP